MLNLGCIQFTTILFRSSGTDNDETRLQRPQDAIFVLRCRRRAGDDISVHIQGGNF